MMPTLRESLEGAYEELSGEGTQGAGDEAASAPVDETASVESKATDENSEAPESTEAAPVDEVEAEKPEKPPAVAAPGEKPRDATGKFLKAKTTATKPPDVPVTGAKTVTPTPKPGEATATKAPQSWRPTERNAWAKVPPEAQAAIARREAEIVRAMQESAPQRQVGQQFQSMLAPYEGLIKSLGGSPMQTVENAVQTLYALHTAPAGHKAGIVANIISQFGIDPGHVAQVLQGQAPQGQQQPDPQQFAQQLRQQGFLTREDIQQQQQASLERHFESKWQEFSAANEFAEDLRGPIGKLIAAGLAKDFQDAYAKASSMDPEISSAMRQREEAKQAKAAIASTQRARAASTSLKSSPAGPSGGSQPKGVRGSLEHSWDVLSGTQR